MKKILFPIAALLTMTFAAPAFSQKQTAIVSEAFDEPEGLESKVVQCSNGNTFLFNFTKRDGIETTIFGKDRKEQKTFTIVGKLWDAREMPKSSISGIYEIQGNLVVFIEQLSGRVPSLYRFNIDTRTGKVSDEEKLAEMPKYGRGAGYAMAFGGVQPKGFHIAKDPVSDNYSIVAFDGFADETDHRIEVIAYDGNHKQVSRAYYDSPENRYKYINFIGMTVAEGTTYLCTYAYNTEAHGGKASKVVLSKLVANSKTMEHSPLEATRNYKNTNAILEYNPGKKTLELLTLSFLESKGGGFFSNSTTTTYSLSLTTFETGTMTMVRSNNIGGRKLAEYAAARFGSSERFAGIPMDMIINPDHTVSVVFEETMTRTTSNGRTSSTSYILGDMGILDFDAMGNEQDGFMVRKEQILNREVPAMSLYQRHQNRVDFDRRGFGMVAGPNSGFYSCDYISTPKGRYLIFNDNPDNFDREERKKPYKTMGISHASTTCYKLDSKGEWTKFYPFGAPDKEVDNRFAYISAGDYNAKLATYATMFIEVRGRKKQAHIAWIDMN